MSEFYSRSFSELLESESAASLERERQHSRLDALDAQRRRIEDDFGELDSALEDLEEAEELADAAERRRRSTMARLRRMA